jgi:hypothetical protein
MRTVRSRQSHPRMFMYNGWTKDEQCFLCLCWNMCSQYISTLCTLWSLWWQQCFFTIWQQMSLVFLIDSLECSLSSLQLPSDHYKRWRIPPQANLTSVSIHWVQQYWRHRFTNKMNMWRKILQLSEHLAACSCLVITPNLSEFHHRIFIRKTHRFHQTTPPITETFTLGSMQFR